ncbi:MAG: WD40/YVTN/BNR-like repeat-containing protein [Planctomycetota bacterium]|jgi:photosystem II stability/assembly factor-like uncharacterized protein
MHPAVLPAAAALAALLHAPHDPISVWAISPDFTRDRTLYVGQNAFGLMLRSRDGGETFTSINAGFDTGYVSALAISPDFARDRKLLAVDRGRLYRTTDGGDLWAEVTGVPEDVGVVSLAFSPAHAEDRSVALGTAKHGVLISRDAGATFTATPLPSPGPVAQLAFSPDYATDRTLVAVVPPNRACLTHDGGTRWTQLAEPPASRVHAVLLDDARTIRLATDQGLLLSTDGGLSWQAGPEGPGRRAVLQLAAAPDAEGPALFAAAAEGGVFVRRGDTWSVSRDGMRELSDQSDTHTLGVMPSPGFAEDGTLYAATFEGLHVSTDRGAHWRHLQVLPARFTRAVEFSPRFAADGTLYVSSYGLGTLRSRDRGRTWERLETGTWDFPDGMALSPGYPEDPTLLIGSPTALLLSHDDGQGFADVLPERPGFAHVAAFAPDHASSGTIFVHTLEFGNDAHNDFLRSDDRGATWTRTGPRTIHALAFAPDFATSGRMYVATPSDVQVSLDRGRSWEPLPGLPRAMMYGVAATTGPQGRDRLLAVSPMAGTFLSTDGGASWTRDDLGLDGARATAAAFSPAHASDGREYLLTQFEGLFGRGPGETRWRRLGLRGEYALRLSLSPGFATDRTLAVAGYAGPWLSTDAGESFTLLDVWSGRPGEPPPRVGRGLVATSSVASSVTAPGMTGDDAGADATADGAGEAEPEPWQPGLMTWVLAGLSAAIAIRLGAWAARRRHAAR